jgi:arginyl-tRNA synthetase
VPAALRAELRRAPDWESARNALAANVTAILGVKAGATLVPATERGEPQTGTTDRSVEKALDFAGEDAVRFALVRGGLPPDAERIARHVLGNPAYAVRYAHAAAAAVLRWAGTRPGLTTYQPGEFRPGQLTEPEELALLDALSWLPERVATAARRRRADGFARYLEVLASRTIDTMSTTSYRAGSEVASERLWLADAARTGLAAGLGLLGINAPDRI